MSIVVRNLATRKVYVFTKGADCTVIEMSKQNKQAELDVEYFANQGLRTLVFAYKELQSLGSLIREDVECNLTILGATGVEDLMQENAKETIEDFRDAGIRVWMLTGDKGITSQ